MMSLLSWILVGISSGILYVWYLSKFANYYRNLSEYEFRDATFVTTVYLLTAAPMGGPITTIILLILTIVDIITTKGR